MSTPNMKVVQEQPSVQPNLVSSLGNNSII